MVWKQICFADFTNCADHCTKVRFSWKMRKKQIHITCIYAWTKESSRSWINGVAFSHNCDLRSRSCRPNKKKYLFLFPAVDSMSQGSRSQGFSSPKVNLDFRAIFGCLQRSLLTDCGNTTSVFQMSERVRPKILLQRNADLSFAAIIKFSPQHWLHSDLSRVSATPWQATPDRCAASPTDASLPRKCHPHRSATPLDMSPAHTTLQQRGQQTTWPSWPDI